MISKLKGIILAVMVLLASIMMPFDVYADTISASNIHLNTSLISVNYDHTPTFYNYEYEFVFDKQYVGWVSVKVVNTYYSDNNFTQSQYTFTKAIYVNGGTASITNGFYSTGNFSGGCLVSASFSIVSSNVTEYSVINSLEQITDILTDVSNYVSIDVLSELQNIVSNTSLANDYLQLISKIRSYDIPFESLLITTYFNSYHDPEDIYLSGVYDFKFPIYKMNGRSFRLYGYAGHQYKMIALTKASTLSAFNNSFSISPNTGMSLVSASYSGDTYFFRQTYLYLMTYTFQCTNTNNYFFDFVGSDTSYYVVPIYYGDVNNKKISTDFALRFGLSNQLLDDLQIIANGTTASENAAGQLESTTSNFDTASEQLTTFEDSMNDDMNDKLDVIDTTTGLNIFGQNFLTSAEWVRIQFNHLTTNTPYGSMVVYGLTLGLALLLLGKVFL